MMSDNKKDSTPPDARISGDRHSESIVPALGGSSSCEGHVSPLATSGGTHPVIVSNENLQTRVVLAYPKDDYTQNKDHQEASTSTAKINDTNLSDHTVAEMDISEIISISSDDDEIPAGMDMSKSAKKRRKKRKMVSSPEIDNEEDSIPDKEKFTVNTRSRIDELTANLHLESIPDVNAQINEHLSTIQDIRRKTKNMRGSDKGKIKVLVEAIRVAARNMAIRATSSEDPIFWRAKYYDLENQVLDIKAQNISLTKKLETLQRNIQNRDAMEFPDYSVDLDENELLSLSGIKKGNAPRRLTDAATNTSTNDNTHARRETAQNSGLVDLFGSTSVVRDKVDINISIIHAIDRLNSRMTQLAHEIKALRDRDDKISVDLHRHNLQQNRIDNYTVNNKKQHKNNNMNKKSSRQVANSTVSQPHTHLRVKFDDGESEGSISSSSVQRISKKKTNVNKKNYNNNNNRVERENTYHSNVRNVEFSSYTEEETPKKAATNVMPGDDSVGMSSQDTSNWASVVKRGRSKKKENTNIRKRNTRLEESLISGPTEFGSQDRLYVKNYNIGNNSGNNTGNGNRIMYSNREAISILKKKLPNSAAISIICTNPDVLYSDIMKLAREKISLRDIGIENTKIRRAVSGGVIIEIFGRDCSLKADRLHDELRKLFANDGSVHINRPVKKVQLKLSGLDDSVTILDIKKAFTENSKCNREDVTCGPIRFFRGGLGTSVVQCPVAIALHIFETGNFCIGWSTIHIELLKARPVRCFRCFAVGHTVQRCPSAVDRTQCCFRCGLPGHKSLDCVNEVRCPVCDERNLSTNHLAGGERCIPVRPKIVKTRVVRESKSSPVNKNTHLGYNPAARRAQGSATADMDIETALP